MLKLFVIVVIVILIFIFTYLQSEENKLTKAIVCSGIVAVLSFVGPYIVDYISSLDDRNKNEVINEETDINVDIDGPSDDILLKHEHLIDSEIKENIINATCIATGSYDLVSYCKCGEELNRKVFTIEALGHNYIDTITPPSCEESGFTTYTCSRCNDSYKDNYTDAFGHNFVGGVCAQCGSVSPGYESLIISQANELVDSGDFDSASDLVINALNITNSGSLQQLLDDIQSLQEKESNLTAKKSILSHIMVQ